ncbi:hypothetical protein GCK32_004078 [Trichostrongylus colubriformis]|uniref:Uncharacterized protein n=1 Tax=Trichostrongylus colubriformis TaxID=6319 RepID=A0AAN8FIW5_TRICO
MRFVLLITALISVATAFQCSADTILRMATDKRLKQLDRDCKMAASNEAECANKYDVENSWKDFTKLSDRYKEAVAKCRATAASSKQRYRRSHGKLITTSHEQAQTVQEMTRPESEEFDMTHPIRTRRQICKTKSSLELNQFSHDFGTHCERDNICLPDEDLPPGPQRDGFKELHAARAKKYSDYLTQLYRCYGRL